MAKAILEFDLNEYHDTLAFKRATSATDAYLVLFELSEVLRKSDNEDIKNKFHLLIDKYSIDLEDLE